MPSHANEELKKGRELFASGQVMAAHNHFLEAVRLDPNSAELRYGLAMCEWVTGQMTSARELLQKAIELDPKLAVAHSWLGEWYLSHGMIEPALESTGMAMQIEPENPAILLSRGWALEAAGENEEAWGLVKKLVGAPGQMTPSVARLYGRLAGRFGEQSQAMAAITSLMNGGGAGHDWLLQFTLAELLDKAGRYDEAFAMALRANASQANASPRARAYGPDVSAKWAAIVSDYFNPEKMRSLARASARNEKPVFIVGMPRSGTSLVEQVAASHPAVHGAGELDFMFGVINGLMGMLKTTSEEYPRCLDRLTTEIADGMAEVYLVPLTSLAPTAERITDKMPLNWFHLGLISLLFPGARIIHCRRDPMDTCLSCFMTHFNQGHEYKHNLGHLGHFYRVYERMMSHWKSAIDLPILDVFYEDVVTDLPGQARRLIEFLGLGWDDRCLTPHKTQRAVVTASVQQVRQPVYNSSVHRWRKYEKHLGPLKAALWGNSGRSPENGASIWTVGWTGLTIFAMVLKTIDLRGRSKREVAERLAQAHYTVEPGIELIVQLEAPAKREADPKEPVKLLEVNRETTSDGIRPIFFGPHEASGIFYPSVIVEITPEEYRQIRRKPSLLPNRWRLGRKFAKSAPGAA